MPPDISVVISTYDRPQFLKRSVNSVLNQSISDKQYEILIIQNKYNKIPDDVKQSIDNQQISWYSESGGSLSHGRNVGIKNAMGDIVAFLDDDAVADTYWLESIITSYESIQPEPDCVGGPVIPQYESDPPEWLPDKLGLIGICDYGENQRWLDFPDEYIIGANMSFKLDKLVEIGGFPTNLGRQKGSLLSNEEIIVQEKLSTDPYYQPNARVTHHIENHRLTPSYLIRRSFYQGISEYRTQKLKAASNSSKVRDKYESNNKRLQLLWNQVMTNLLSGDQSSTVLGVLNFAFGIGYLSKSIRERISIS
jgi:glycosyltransferase involved in cell wall biosynthesis